MNWILKQKECLKIFLEPGEKNMLRLQLEQSGEQETKQEKRKELSLSDEI